MPNAAPVQTAAVGGSSLCGPDDAALRQAVDGPRVAAHAAPHRRLAAPRSSQYCHPLTLLISPHPTVTLDEQSSQCSPLPLSCLFLVTAVAAVIAPIPSHPPAVLSPGTRSNAVASSYPLTPSSPHTLPTPSSPLIPLLCSPQALEAMLSHPVIPPSPHPRIPFQRPHPLSSPRCAPPRH
ncbi:unnamed protein product [Closterium sp. Naga37s-1]|nr:unnamed protein product [Closterium sp. Naga37s-1]